LQAAQAQATDASRNAQRFQELFNQQLVSNQEYDNAQLQSTIGRRQVEQRSAELAAAKRQQLQIREQLREARKGPTNPELGQALAGAVAAQDNAKAVQADLANHYRIVSSLNGIVVERLKDPGDLGRPGESILKVVNPQTLEVVCSVEENDLAKIHVGDETYIVLDAMPEVALKGKIRRVGSQVNPDNGTVETRVVLLPSEWARFKTLKLLPGMTADVNVITGHLKQALVIPAAAVKNDSGRWYAFVFENQKLVKRAVQGERISMENFRVTGGLQAGVWIAAVANEKLLEKKNVQPVAVTEPAAPAAKPPARMLR
jgi:RND family efflux transporter MFP subunit